MKKEVHKDTEKPKKFIIPVGMPFDLKKEIEETASCSEGLSEQDVIRMSLRKGLPLLKKILQAA